MTPAERTGATLADGSQAAPQNEAGARAQRAREAAKAKDLRIVVGVLVVAAFSPPALLIVSRDLTILGLPLLVAYVFGAWLAGIIATGVLIARSRAKGEED